MCAYVTALMLTPSCYITHLGSLAEQEQRIACIDGHTRDGVVKDTTLIIALGLETQHDDIAMGKGLGLPTVEQYTVDRGPVQGCIPDPPLPRVVGERRVISRGDLLGELRKVDARTAAATHSDRVEARVQKPLLPFGLPTATLDEPRQGRGCEPG